MADNNKHGHQQHRHTNEDRGTDVGVIRDTHGRTKPEVQAHTHSHSGRHRYGPDTPTYHLVEKLCYIKYTFHLGSFQ